MNDLDKVISEITLLRQNNVTCKFKLHQSLLKNFDDEDVITHPEYLRLQGKVDALNQVMEILWRIKEENE